ncbi:MAG: sugar phosphate nucleotidyltransferase [Candidatus Eisenbacteria bacterium]
MNGEIRQAIVPCGGLGKRLDALRWGRPKEMLSLAGKPLVRRVVEEALRGGARLVAVVVRPGKEEIVRYLSSPSVREELRVDREGRSILFVVQEEPTGLADAIALAWRGMEAEPSALLLPDNIYDGNGLAEILPAYLETRRSTAGLLSLDESEWGGFGNCGGVRTEPEGSVLRVVSLGSKGKGPFRGEPGGGRTLRWYGRVILTPRFLTLMESVRFPPGGERDDVPVLQALVEDEGVAGVPLRERGFDVGNPEGLARAEAYFGRGEAEGGR